VSLKLSILSLLVVAVVVLQEQAVVVVQADLEQELD
jgi:hypothetical protein